MRPPLPLLLFLPLATACGAAEPHAQRESDPGARRAIGAVLDDWHDAASRADEDRYFNHLTSDAVFLGTDATERWDKAAFRAYAHPHFAKGKAWSFKASRRAVMLDAGGALAWFDEDLVTQNLGPARGSGVMAKEGSAWKIKHYNLTITVPNERFDAVKRAAAGLAPEPCAPPPK